MKYWHPDWRSMSDGFGRIGIETSRSVYTMDEIAERVRPVARRYKVSKIYVYGAYAKGQADSGSDVELLVDFGKAFGYFGRGGFCMDLNEALCKNVSAVPIGYSEEFVDSIRNEMVEIYDAEKDVEPAKEKKKRIIPMRRI